MYNKKMKYVFFDSESIDKQHKYSFTFGYIVTDEKFNVLNPSEDIVFNPDIPKENWDFWAYKKLLKNLYPQNILQSAKKFTYYYDKIKRLFKDEEVICIGFEINEDVKYLLNNCDRYNLEPINFKYVDVRQIIKFLTNEKPKSLSVEYVKYTCKPCFDAHRSNIDAEMTMCVLREVLKKYDVRLEDIIHQNKSLVGKINGFVYGFENLTFDIKNPKESSHVYVGGTKASKTKEGRENCIDRGSVNDLLFTRFLNFVQPTCERTQILKNKKVSISLNYESTNYQNMLKLVQMITDVGGRYIKKASLADIFVKEKSSSVDENDPKYCSRYKYVMDAIEKEGKEIEILEFDDFLTMFGLTCEQLDTLPNIDVEYLKNPKYKKSKK